MTQEAFCRTLVLLSLLPSCAACADGDTRCEDKGCSAFCNRYTCTHPDCLGCDKAEGCPAHPPSPPPPPKPPPMPPWYDGIEPGGLAVYTQGSKIYANGEQLHIKGVNCMFLATQPARPHSWLFFGPSAPARPHSPHTAARFGPVCERRRTAAMCLQGLAARVAPVHRSASTNTKVRARPACAHALAYTPPPAPKLTCDAPRHGGSRVVHEVPQRSQVQRHSCACRLSPPTCTCVHADPTRL